MQKILLFGLGAASLVVACSSSNAPIGPSPALTTTAQASSASGAQSSASASGGGGAGTGGASTSVSGSGGGAGTGGSGGKNLAEGPSCKGGLDCGGTSCCQFITVPGGTFPMGRSTDGPDAYAGGAADELPEHMATVGSFALDTFEVTVGRFRKFVAAFDGTPPMPGAGAHPLIANSGWQAEWSSSLADSKATLMKNLACSDASQTWTDAASTNESMAIDCVSWFEAAAFCAWDGGRLPTEAEWEYAACGGSDNRLYPWGADDPSSNKTLANYVSSDGTSLLAVGSHPSGNGKWGHRDLAGGMFEWTMDGYDAAWYAGGGATCSNCADINEMTSRVLRGGSWLSDPDRLRAAARIDDTPADRSENGGFRCARDL